MNLQYRASNADHEILKRLIQSGLIPVYVRIQNRGDQPVTISETNFTLKNEDAELSALNSGLIPRELERFHPGAALANIYNVTVVVIMMSLLMATILAATNGVDTHESWKLFSGEHYSEPVFNDTRKITQINYRTYLIQQGTIAPQESLEGLLFFRAKPDTMGEYDLQFH